MLTHRVVIGDNGTLLDKSLEARGDGFTQTYINAEDYLYIGQKFPFNSIWLDIETANVNAGLMGIEYWASNEWVTALDVLDETLASGITLAQSGIIRFQPDTDSKWSILTDPRKSSNPSDLADVDIWNQYWARLRPTADTSATLIKQIGYLFCEDADLIRLDPDINKFLDKWLSGKTSWLKQRLAGTEHVVIDFKGRGLISGEAAVLQIDEELNLLTAYRTLAIIYSGLAGSKFVEKRNTLIGEDGKGGLYGALVEKIKPVTDKDNDAAIDQQETKVTSGSQTR